LIFDLDLPKAEKLTDDWLAKTSKWTQFNYVPLDRKVSRQLPTWSTVIHRLLYCQRV